MENKITIQRNTEYVGKTIADTQEDNDAGIEQKWNLFQNYNGEQTQTGELVKYYQYTGINIFAIFHKIHTDLGVMTVRYNLHESDVRIK